ncbi:MAG TPA: aldose 1-epimerase family protein [Anaerolineae bacterium]|nr:aldose 1-epimerase family protein [Anaerolineae bacterium]
MPSLFNGAYSRTELGRFTSTLDQLAGVRLAELSDGRARGMRVADAWTGSGLRFSVLLDRGLDIGAAEFQGVPLAWLHPALGTPAQYEPAGYGWLRTFGGGLLTTCGLSHFGQPETDGDEALGLHGRISHIAAHQVRVSAEWQGEEYLITIEGSVRQAALFGENLLLHRRITTSLGATSFLVEDCVRNEGYRPAPHMILYHCNLGFPIVSPESSLEVDDISVRPRDAAAAAGLERHAYFDPPVPGYPEQVFFHLPRPGPDGQVTASIANPVLGLSAYVRYRAAELPAFSQWKMMGAGEYVCALEPCTVHETPRSALRREGRLALLDPGEEIHYRVELGVTRSGG